MGLKRLGQEAEADDNEDHLTHAEKDTAIINCNVEPWPTKESTSSIEMRSTDFVIWIRCIAVCSTVGVAEEGTNDVEKPWAETHT